MKNSSLIKLLLASTALLNTAQVPAADYYTTRAQGVVSFLSHGDNLETRDQAGNRRVNTITLSVINQDPVAKLILDGSNAIFSIDAPHRQLGQIGVNEVVINELGLASNSRQNTLRIRGRLRNDLTMQLTRVNDAVAKEISLHLGGNPQELQEEYVYDQFLNRPVLSGSVILVDGTPGKETLEYKGSNFAFKEVKLEDTDSELILSGVDLNGNAAVTVTSPIFAFDPNDINSIRPKGSITLRENTRFTNTLGRAPSANGTWRTAPIAMLSIDAGKSVVFTKDTEVINLDLNGHNVITLGDGATVPESRISSDITFIINDIMLPINGNGSTDTNTLIINNPNRAVTIKEKVGDEGSPIGTITIVDTTDAQFKGGLYAGAVSVAPDKKITLGHDSEVNKISLQGQNSVLRINADANSKLSLAKADPVTGTGIIPDRNGEGIIEITQAKMFECSTDVGQPGSQLSEISVNAEAAKFAKKIYTRLMTIGPKSEVILLNEENAIQRLVLGGQNSTLTLGGGDAATSKDISFTDEISIPQNNTGVLRINNPSKKVELGGNQINTENTRFHNIDLQAGELQLNTVGDKVIYTQDLTVHDGAKVLDNEAIDVSGKVIIVDVKQIDDQLVRAIAKKPIGVLEFKGDGQTFQYVSNEKLAKVMVLAGENQVFISGRDHPPLYNLGDKNILASDTIPNALKDIEEGRVHISNGVIGAKIFRAIGIEADMHLNADNQTDIDLINSIKGKAKGIAFVGPKTQKITLKGLFNVEGIYTAQDDSGTLEIVDNSFVSGQLGDVDRKLNKVVVRTDLGPGSSQIVGAVFVNNLELNNQGLLVRGDNSDVGAITLRSDTEIKFTGKANVASIDAENLHEGTAKFTKGGRIGGIGQNIPLNFIEFAGNNQDFFLDGNISAARIRFEGVKVSFSNSKNTHLIAQNVVDLENAKLNIGAKTLNITSLGQINLIGDITLQLRGRDQNNFGKLILDGQNCNSDDLNSLLIEATPAKADTPMVVEVFENSTGDVINMAKLRVSQGWTKLYNGQRLSISYTPPVVNRPVAQGQPRANVQPAQPQVFVIGDRAGIVDLPGGGEAVVGRNRDRAPADNAPAVENRREEAPNRRRAAIRRDQIRENQEAQENRQNQNNDRDAAQEARIAAEQIRESVNSIFRSRDHIRDYNRDDESVATSRSSRLLSSMRPMSSQQAMITPEDEKHIAEIATEIIEALKDSSSSVEAITATLQSPVGSPSVEKKAQVLEYAQAVKQAASTGQLQSMIARTHSVVHDHTSPVKDLGSTVTHGLGRRLEIDVVDNSSISSSQFAASGDAIPGLSLWGNVIAARSNQESLDVPGYAGSAQGFTIGGEYSSCGQKKLGIAYTRAGASYSYTGDRTGDTLGFTGNVLSLYGSYNADGHFGHIIGNISRGTAATSRARIGKTTSVAQGSFAVRGYGVEGIIGHNFILGDGFHFAPRVGLEYNYSYNDSYEEKGAGAQNLAVDAQTSTVLSGSLGFRLAYVNEISSLTRVVPEIVASVERELSNSSGSNKAVKTRFVWSDEYLDYDVSNAQDAKTSINIGGGLRIKHDIFEVSASYRYHNKLNAKYTDHQGLFSVKIEL